MRVLLAVSLTLLLASAQADTLKRVAESGEFRIGFVPDAPPLSFVDNDGTAIGYSIDLCNHIASSVQQHLGLEKMNIVYTPLVSMPERSTLLRTASSISNAARRRSRFRGESELISR